MKSQMLLQRELVLLELQQIAPGRRAEQQTTLVRFTKCQDWQHAADLKLFVTAITA